MSWITFGGTTRYPTAVTRSVRLLLAGRAVRTFAYGAVSMVLALHLERRGLTPQAIGVLFTATLLEDALATGLVSAFANRLGRRRVLVASGVLVAVSGLALAWAQDAWVLVLVAVLGTLSPGGQEAGAFSPLEQALLADLVAPGRRPRAFAAYNVAGYLPSALGALAVGVWLPAAARLGWGEDDAFRAVLGSYALAGVLLAALFSALPKPPLAVAAAKAGLQRSRGVVLEMAGLIETMVLSHLPSNVLLLLVPLAPSFSLAAALLLARHLLSQMDVPTRQAYVMALVAPEERPAAAGLTSVARSVAQACSPAVSGLALASAASGLPFFLAGGLKILYDLAVYVRFRGRSAAL